MPLIWLTCYSNRSSDYMDFREQQLRTKGLNLPLHSGIVSVHIWESNRGCLLLSIRRPIVRPNE